MKSITLSCGTPITLDGKWVTIGGKKVDAYELMTTIMENE